MNIELMIDLQSEAVVAVFCFVLFFLSFVITMTLLLLLMYFNTTTMIMIKK